MRSQDLTRPLLRWLYVNQVRDGVILVCPYTDLGKVPRTMTVVETPTCLGSASGGLCAQLLAIEAGPIHIAEGCEEPEEPGHSGALLDLFPTLKRWEPGGKRRGTRRPGVLYLGQIPLPRRMVLGFVKPPKGPLDLSDDEHTRELAALEILRTRGHLRESSSVVAASGELATRGRRLDASGCVACSVCVSACPHGALSLPALETAASLIYDPNLCQGDLQCVQLCPVGALTDEGPLPIASLGTFAKRVLANVPVARCHKCRAAHADTSQKYCRSCQGRISGGFGATANVDELLELAKRQRELLFGSPADPV